jgi:hypothetical protein
MKVTDELGLCPDNSFIVAYMPAVARALVFRVVSRMNRDAEVIPYGPLPLPAGVSLPTYDGTTVSVPSPGVIPSRAFTPSGISFPIGSGTSLPFETAVFTATDMWYLPEDYRERIFHIVAELTPSTLRCDLQIPTGVTQKRFQRDRVTLGIEYDWGFRRGRLETIQVPGVHYGWRFGNDLNIDFHTHILFKYGEYVVEIPKDPAAIFDILTSRIPSHWVTLPIIASYDPSLSRALRANYGIEGFPLYGAHERAKALSEYEKILREAKI